MAQRLSAPLMPGFGGRATANIAYPCAPPTVNLKPVTIVDQDFYLVGLSAGEFTRTVKFDAFFSHGRAFPCECALHTTPLPKPLNISYCLHG
jgi:hypothetical protein